MNNFLKIIRTLRKSSLEDIGKKLGIKVIDLDRDTLISSIEENIGRNKNRRKFTSTSLFQIGFPMLTALFGVCIGLVIDISNVEVSNNIIKSQETESMLNSDIENLTLIVDLRKRLLPKDFTNDDIFAINNGFLLRLHGSNMSEGKSLSVLTAIGRSMNQKGPTWSFNSEAYTIKEYRTKIRTGYGIVSFDNELKSIPLAISLENSVEKPFIKVRDLNEVDIDLFLPEEVANLTSKVRIVVNSGYSFRRHLMIFEKFIDKVSWEETEYKINNNYSSIKMDLKSRYVKSKSDSYENKWKINLDEVIMVENELGLPDYYRIPY